MKIGIVTRPNENQWGGDLKALYSIKDGLIENDIDVELGRTALDLKDCDFIFLSNTCLDQRENYNWLKNNNKRYGVIGFHEDFIKYFSKCIGFTNYIKQNVTNQKNNGFDFSLERLEEMPEIVDYFSVPPIQSTLYNYNVLKDAEVCIANSVPEAMTMKRDCPDANINVVYWTSGWADEWNDSPDESFLELTNLKSKNYILQVGRLETRKNQLATLLASKDLDIPLVFIATKGYQGWYEQIFISAAIKHRKHKTILISENLSSQIVGNLEIIQMPNNEKLPSKTLQSAYFHSRVHCHPAFYELPGYTYLEGLKYGIPTVGSKWCSVYDYLDHFENDESVGGLIKYSLPYDLKSIKNLLVEQLKKNNELTNIKFFNRTVKDLGKDIINTIKTEENEKNYHSKIME